MEVVCRSMSRMPIKIMLLIGANGGPQAVKFF
jgi:hypothetical protein